MPETKDEDMAGLKARIAELEDYSLYAVRTVARELRLVRRRVDAAAREVGVTIPEAVCKPSDRLLVLLNGMGRQMGAMGRTLNSIGRAWGYEWRERIGRGDGAEGEYFTILGDGTTCSGDDTAQKPYRTITGNASEQAHSTKGAGRYLSWPQLLDAFDLPEDFDMDKVGYFQLARRSKARFLTQGVPVAAAYALACAVREALVGEV